MLLYMLKSRCWLPLYCCWLGTSMIPSGLLAKLLPCMLGINPLASWEFTPYMLGIDSLSTLWATSLAVYRMARIGKHLKPTLNQPGIKWSSFFILHGGSGGPHEMMPLMASNVVTSWHSYTMGMGALTIGWVLVLAPSPWDGISISFLVNSMDWSYLKLSTCQNIPL